MCLNEREKKGNKSGDLPVEGRTCVVTAKRHSSTSSLASMPAALLFLSCLLLFSATVLTVRLSCSSGCCRVKAPAEGGQGKGEVPLSQEGGGEEQPVSRYFLHCEQWRCWLGIKEEKVCRELLLCCG